jgi:hypothetical protein
VPVQTLQSADLSPKTAREVGERLLELAEQAEDRQVVRVAIVAGGAVGFQGRGVVAELLEESEER